MAKMDMKQVLLAHGERIGLGVCGALAVVLLATSLFLPGRGVFSGSSVEKAKAIDEPTAWVQQKLRDPNNLPGPNEKPPENVQLIGYTAESVKHEDYSVASFGPPIQTINLGRRVPRIFPVEEGVAGVDHVNIQSYIFDFNSDPPKVLTLQADGGAAGGAGGTSGAPPRGADRLGRMFGPAGRGMVPPGRAAPAGGGAGYMGMSPLGMPSSGTTDEGAKDKKIMPISVTELDKHADATLAEQVRPLRLAVIAASFPYKKQIEEFRAKLVLKSNELVLGEQSKETGPDKSPLPAFRFLGVNIQRREVDPDGKPVSEFLTLKPGEDYGPYIFLTGRRFEPEDPVIEALSFPGLVMPRLLQFNLEGQANASGAPMPGGGAPAAGTTPSLTRGSTPPAVAGAGAGPTAKIDPSKDKYPKVEKELKLLNQTIRTLQDKYKQVAAPPEKFQRGNFDVFSSRPTTVAPAGEAPKEETPATPQGTELPDYCLVRVIDVTVQPGKRYEYRLQVRMANPNFGREDVANPNYATEKELVSEWSQVPIAVGIKPDLMYYAVDEKDLFEKQKIRDYYKGPYTNENFNKDRFLMVQAHRWVESVRLAGSSNPLLVGEWVVAERYPVARGEYVGHKERVEVPYWRFAREEYAIATDSTTTKWRKGIEVPFGYNAPNSNLPEAILVDFDTGKHGYNRVVSVNDDKVEMKAVTDNAAVEALLLNPDGKLFLMEGARDAVDEERIKRKEEVKKRLDEVRDKGKPGGEKKDRFGS
jgi:hypothetical protein